MRVARGRGSLAAGLCIFLGTFGVLSCTPPTAIATFAGGADKAISQGAPIFADIHESCVRRQSDEARIVPDYPHADQDNPKNAASAASVCASFVTEVKELESVSSILSAYFRAMQELAAFDQSKVSVQAKEAGQSAGAAAVLSFNQIDSVAKLSDLITRAFTQHYQSGKLREFLGAADPHVAAISQALEKIVSTDYAGMLDEEERAINRRYQRVSGARDSATVLLLNRAYAADLNELRRRKTMADNYSKALEQVRDGHHQLSENAGHLSNKQIALALQPYISQLQALASATQVLVVQDQP